MRMLMLSAVVIMLATKLGSASPEAVARAAAARNSTRPASRSGQAATNLTALEFLPPIERVLAAPGGIGERVYFSFTNGTAALETRAENAQLNRQLHRNLKLYALEDDAQWTGVDLEVVRASEELWNATPGEVIAALKDDLSPPLPTMQVVPAVWFFRTREGNYGMMRVVGLVDVPPGRKAMKFVYKLARTRRPAKAVSMALPLTERIKQFLAGEPATTGYGLEIWEQNPAGRGHAGDKHLRPRLFSEICRSLLYSMGGRHRREHAALLRAIRRRPGEGAGAACHECAAALGTIEKRDRAVRLGVAGIPVSLRDAAC